MCPIPNISLKTYLYAFLATVFLSLCLYCNFLHEENEKWEVKYSNLETSYKEKVAALTECSDGVRALKDREEELTKNAKVAVEKAKKEAIAQYKAANDLLNRKPKDPVITPENEKDYGGNDIMIQLKDYMYSHELLNELIDKERHND